MATRLFIAKLQYRTKNYNLCQKQLFLKGMMYDEISCI